MVRWLHHDGFPVAENFKRRGCKLDVVCYFYGFKNEASKHLFIHYLWTKELWRKLSIKEWPPHVEENVSNRLWFFFAKGTMECLKKIMVGVRTLWYNRNLMNHDKAGKSVDWCCNRIKALLGQFASKSIVGYSQGAGDGTRGTRVFFDGSMSLNSDIGGVAVVVVWDSCIQACCAKWTSRSSSSLEVECLALINGMSLAEKMGWEQDSFYSDSSKAVWTIQSGEWETWEFGEVVEAGLDLLQRH
ncbi:hypothetical protein QQ045_017768 [Rhodiola kirilowii]